MQRVQSKRNNQTETRDSLDTIGDFPAPRVKRVELWFPFAFFISSDDESFQFVLHIAALTLHEAIKESRKKNRQRNKKPWIFKVWNYQSEIFPWNMEYGKIGSQKNPEVLWRVPMESEIWNWEKFFRNHWIEQQRGQQKIQVMQKVQTNIQLPN